jgi:thiol-disulfide isomerase/thioredoxin
MMKLMPLRLALPLASALFVAATATALAAGPAPEVHETLISSSIPSAPYDVSADARAQVAAAIARAAAAHKFVLLDFGGNWCPDCRVTAGVLALDDVKPWIERNFEFVFIDVGRMNRNLDIAARYDVHIRAVPTMIILDSQGHMVNAGNPAALSDARSMTPQAIVDTLHGWIDKAG